MTHSPSPSNLRYFALQEENALFLLKTVTSKIALCSCSHFLFSPHPIYDFVFTAELHSYIFEELMQVFLCRLSLGVCSVLCSQKTVIIEESFFPLE